MAMASLRQLRELTSLPHWQLLRRIGDDDVVLAALPLDVRSPWPLHSADIRRIDTTWRQRTDITAPLTGVTEGPEPHAFIRAPLYPRSERLFGLLQGRMPGTAPIAGHMPHVLTVAKQLSVLLRQEIRFTNAERHADRLAVDRYRHPQLGTLSRKGWEMLVDLEDLRCESLEHPTAIIVARLRHGSCDEPGHSHYHDERYQLLASILGRWAANDCIGELDDQGLALLLPDCEPGDLNQLCDSMRGNFIEAGLKVALSADYRRPERPLRACARTLGKDISTC